MKILRLLVMLPLSLFALNFSARGADDDADKNVAHFTRVEVPANERMLTDLARLREWRCNYEFNQNCESFLLIAEYYKGDVCMGDYILSEGLVFDKPGLAVYKHTGVISVAWHVDFHNLIGTQDHAWFGSGAVHLADFRPIDGSFFRNAKPETREPSGKNAKNGKEFQLYPVLGLCGERELKYPGDGGAEGAKYYLEGCKVAGAKDAVIIYLYISKNSGRPAMDFKESPPEEKLKAEN